MPISSLCSTPRRMRSRRLGVWSIAAVAAAAPASAATPAAAASLTAAGGPAVWILIVLLGVALTTSLVSGRRRRRPAGEDAQAPRLELLSRLPVERGRRIYSVRFGDVAIAVLVSEPEKSAVVLGETPLISARPTAPAAVAPEAAP